MKIKLLEKKFKETTAWAVNAGDLNAYIKVSLLINRHVIFCFSVEVMNKAFTSRNPIKAMLSALESETIGMAKYDALKDRVRAINAWEDL